MSHHHLHYLEFAAQDLQVFKEFYGTVFGWQFQDWGPDYISFSSAGLDGGVRGSETPVAGSTLPVLYSDDLDATEQAVLAAGAQVTQHHDFPGGRRFHFIDPCGNALAVSTTVESE
jgi:predicted enzyme related to lactoylglutathione lyase